MDNPHRRRSSRVDLTPHKPKPQHTRKRRERCFQETPCYSIGYQNGMQDRFPEAARDVHPIPRLLPWRNNLTALSQRYNLYFVASESLLLVYQPEYPDQHVRSHPDLTFKLPVSRLGLSGQMPGDPHAVNNILVANLGDDEIVLCACDDGDIIGYRTKEILDFVPRTKQARNQSSTVAAAFARPPDPIEQPPLRVFFHENVGASAWGLTVHTESRMIAASSNTCNITVWAPALTADSEASSRDRMMDSLIERYKGPRQLFFVSFQDDPNRNSHFPRAYAKTYMVKSRLSCTRQKDRRRTLKGHMANIPAISFCNYGKIPSRGKYLASTSINGTTLIWDVDRGFPVRALTPDKRLQPDGTPIERMNWGVLFLDPSSFTPGPCSAKWATAEGQTTASWPGHPNKIYDISDSRSSVRNTAYWPPRDEKGRELTYRHHFQFPDANSDDELVAFEREDSMGLDSDIDESATRSPDGTRRLFDSVPVSWRALKSSAPFLIDPLSPPTHPLSLIPSAKDLPDSPFLVISSNHINLFQSSSLFQLEEHRDSDSGPITHLFNPLQQKVPRHIADALHPHDRLNLYTYIPQLGIILIGSPIGRVAVLTLHKLVPDADCAPDKNILPDCNEEWCTFRLDHLLPTKAQETKGARPLQQLVGVSAGPVMKGEGRASRERWRVLLLYREGTVLAYELGRSKERGTVVRSWE